MQRGQAFLVDTNIIIEAVRTGCWNALTTHFSGQPGGERQPYPAQLGDRVLHPRV